MWHDGEVTVGVAWGVVACGCGMRVWFSCGHGP